MAWVFVGISSVATVTTTSHALSEPSGVQQGDLLVAVISSRIASTTSITLPSGGEWTLVTEQKTNNTQTTSSGTASGMMAYCVRGSSAPNLTFTHPTAPSVAMGRIVAYRGVSPSSPKDTQSSFTTATGTTAVSGTGLTTGFADDLIVVGACGGQEAAWSAFDAATDPTTGSGTNSNQTADPITGTWQERADSNTTTGADTSLAIADAVRGTAGATGNFTATASIAAAHVIVAGAFKFDPGTYLYPAKGDLTLTESSPTSEIIIAPHQRLPVVTRIVRVDQQAAMQSTALGSARVLFASGTDTNIIPPKGDLVLVPRIPNQTTTNIVLRNPVFSLIARQPNVIPSITFGGSINVNLISGGTDINITPPKGDLVLVPRIPNQTTTNSVLRTPVFSPPVARPIAASILTVLGTAAVLLADVPKPFAQTEWPNPRGPRPVVEQFGFTDATEHWLLNTLKPISQVDWPNPQPQRRRNEQIGFLDPYKVLLFAAPPKPFNLKDWPNPQKPRSLQIDQLSFSDPTEHWLLNTLKPISQIDWPNPQPQRRRNEQIGFRDPYKVLLFALPPKPFLLSDWPNPQKPRSLQTDQLGFVDATEHWLLNTLKPISQVDWPNPTRGKFVDFSYILDLNLQLQIQPSPFNQFYWSNPPQVRSVVPDSLSNRFNLYNLKPFVQADWPNPVRSKPAPKSYFGHFDVYKVNLRSNPHHQTDWPNPPLGAPRTFANFGFSVRQQIVPGLFAFPVAGQLALVTYEPMRTIESQHVWRARFNLTGDAVTNISQSGNIDKTPGLQGEVDKKEDLQGG